MLKKRDYKVYRFKTIDDTIIYVGFTGKEVIERFGEHCKDKYWINDVVEVEECVVENEAQARINEMYYINAMKPIFNKKDKFEGTVRTKLRPRDKKFSHSFYVMEGHVTTCIPKTNDDHLLVSFVKINGHHIGLYYDSCLNFYFSANDICKSFNISNKDLNKVMRNNNNFIRSTYNVTKNGAEKIQSIYLCNIEGLTALTALSNEAGAKGYISQLITMGTKASSAVNDVNKLFYLDGSLQKLSGERYNNSFIKRRLIFQSLYSENDINNVIRAYNETVKEYDMLFPIEVMAADLFSMIEDLVNEYNVSYKDVVTDFSDYLKKEHQLNYWSIRSQSIAKSESDSLALHFIIALNESVLYEPFLNFYNYYINKAA